MPKSVTYPPGAARAQVCALVCHVQARLKSFGSGPRRAGSDAASVGGGSSRGGGGTPSIGRTSSYGGTSFTSRTSGAVAARRAARESRDSWMRGAGSGEVEEKVCWHTLATRECVLAHPATLAQSSTVPRRP